MKIADLLGRGQPVFSFEFFPPKTDEGVEKLLRTVSDLKLALEPDYISVTYGAGGSTRARTQEIVTRIQNELHVTTMAHLTCVGSTREEIHEIATKLQESGVQNILALRGDPPKDQEQFEVTEGGFAHATDLMGFLQDEFPELGVAGAAYPEDHPESSSREVDLKWTLEKQKQGAGFLVTQLFFDNRFYFDAVERGREAGLTLPIVPGIMPVTNVAQIERFTKMCGATIPQPLLGRLRQHEDDPAAVIAIGIEWAITQCRELLERGAPGLHFYTLNKSLATRSILAAVR